MKKLKYILFISLVILVSCKGKEGGGGDDKNVNVSMFDNAGRLLWTNENNVPSSRSIDIQVSNLRPGLYYVKVESETVRQTAKLIKE